MGNRDAHRREKKKPKKAKTKPVSNPFRPPTAYKPVTPSVPPSSAE
jgi:hypothetical protein